MTDERRKAHLARLETMFHQAPIARSFGMRLSYDAEQRAVFTLPYNAGFDHGLGGIHGGVFATLLDNAGWFTVAAHYETWVATVEFQVRLLQPVQGEELVARGRMVHAGKRLATAEMEVRAGERLVAMGSGTFTVTSQPLPAG
ncbi:MAG TPA: PaaI family thioesterase [Myxococcales bacterium]|nr:PaaI family thioesterase [Myxococcales bacterium]